MRLLELDGISAGYVEGIDILRGIDLRVEAGRITGQWEVTARDRCLTI